MARERADLPPCPARPQDAHKGTFGTVVVVAGSHTMIGAPALCAASALRGGAGLVKVATLPEILPHVLTIEPSATGLLLEGSAEDLAQEMDQTDTKQQAVLAIGPGLGQLESARDLVLGLLQGPRRVVLDADGLNALAATGEPRPPGPPVVMTPHPGEFGRLAKPFGIQASPTDPQQRPEAAVALAKAHRAVVVLKGQRSVVTDGEQVYINATGNPALATAGSGDVLTGVVAALMAQGLEPLEAAVLGAHLHGLAADLWAMDHGPSGLTARDLAAMLPAAFRLHRQDKS